MSLQPQPLDPIPAETVRVARAAFPKGNTYMRMRDEFGILYQDEQFAALFPSRGQPAASPAHLALVSVMQYAEGLSDRQAADAVRARIDWKYVLGLELDASGFDASVLSEFRSRLVEGSAELQLFETLLTALRAKGLLKARGRQRTDSTHVLAAIQTLNRLECVGETLRHALNALAVAAPDWLQAWVPVEWYERYGRRFEEFRLPPGRPERYALAEIIGAESGPLGGHGLALLTAIYAEDVLPWLRQLPAVETLRRVWVQQFYAPQRDALQNAVRWREAADLPPSTLLICSPYDPDARYSQKRSTTWTGYKAHFTETCDDDAPQVITDVHTTPAPVSDAVMTTPIQTQLAARDVLPEEHLVDAGYVTAETLVDSQREHQVDLVGPVIPDPSWQAQEQTGYDTAQFVLDWDRGVATCPQGRQSVSWLPGIHKHAPNVITITFARADCQACPARTRCTRATSGPRQLRVRGREYHEAIQAARQRLMTEAYRTDYATRAGIEGTISQAVRRCDVRHARYWGLAKTHLQHVLTATALNLVRVVAWLEELPRAHTRQSSFTKLMPAAVC
jgi:transposase